MNLKRFLFAIGLLIGSYSVNAKVLTSLALNSGVFTYDSSALSGSSTTAGSPSLMAHMEIFKKHLIGVSTSVHFSPALETTSLYSIGANYRYYFHGQGMSTEVEIRDFKIKMRPKWNSWGQFAINKYTYFLGSNPDEETKFEQNGDFFNIDLGAGSDYDIGKGYRVYTDFSYTLFSFASTDNRIKLKGMLIAFGLAKEY